MELSIAPLAAAGRHPVRGPGSFSTEARLAGFPPGVWAPRPPL